MPGSHWEQGHGRKREIRHREPAAFFLPFHHCHFLGLYCPYLDH